MSKAKVLTHSKEILRFIATFSLMQKFFAIVKISKNFIAKQKEILNKYYLKLTCD